MPDAEHGQIMSQEQFSKYVPSRRQAISDSFPRFDLEDD
jgi:hypothetical protein